MRIFSKIFRFNVVWTQKIHGGCLKITSADTELVFLKNLPIFVVFFRGLVFVYSETLANLVLFYYMNEDIKFKHCDRVRYFM